MDNDKYIVPMIDRAFEIISLMYNSKESIGVSEISKKLEIPKATAYRILYTLGKWNFIQKDIKTDKYELGNAFIKYGSKVKSDIDITSISSNYIDELAKEVGESVSLGIPYEDFVLTIYNAKGEDFHLVSNLIPISPLNCSAMGKLYLSRYSQDKLDSYFSSNKAETRTINSVTDKGGFLDLKNEIEKEGISYDREEYEYGLTCIAVPISSSDDELLATISISGPTSRLEYKGMEYLKENLIKTQRKIEKSLKEYTVL